MFMNHHGNGNLVFGAGGIHRLALRSQRARLLGEALDIGFRSFDVAPAYGNGLNELELGKALKAVRSEVRIASKFGIPAEMYGERHPAAFVLVRAFRKAADKGYGSEYGRRVFSPDAMVASLEDSLRRLGTDYLDRLLIHEPLQPLDQDLAQRLLAQAAALKRQGKIREFGIAGPAASMGGMESLDSIDILQKPLADALAGLPGEGKTQIAYGVYRHFMAAGQGQSGFNGFVKEILDKHRGWELILSTISPETLRSFRELFA